MSSPTKQTRRCRAAKKVKMGRKQKNRVRREGTTPLLFVLDKPVQKGVSE